MAILKNVARETGTLALALLVVVLCFVASYEIASDILPHMIPIDVAYPFAVFIVTFLLGLATSGLVLRGISHLALRKLR